MMYRNRVNLTAIVLALVLSVASARAEVTLPRIFGDHMVVQQKKPVKVWGWAEKGEKVAVTFAGQQAATVAGEDGRWMATLRGVDATATPQQLMVKGKNTITLSDVLVGEVWLTGRQSSIDISLEATKPQEATDEPLVRYFHIERCARHEPQKELPAEGDLSGGRILFWPIDVTIPGRVANAHGPWKVCTKDNNGAMTGAAFIFARDLGKQLSVPVGIIDIPMGVSVLGSWMSPETMNEVGLERMLRDYVTTPEDIKEWDREEAEEKYLKGGRLLERVAFPPEPVFPGYLLLSTSGCYNACLVPIKNLALRGVLLYQGACYPGFPFAGIKDRSRLQVLDYREMRNATYTTYNYNKFLRFKQEHRSFPHFIADWRRTFGDEKIAVTVHGVSDGSERG